VLEVQTFKKMIKMRKKATPVSVPSVVEQKFTRIELQAFRLVTLTDRSATLI
jgi:hypothetical protein